MDWDKFKRVFADCELDGNKIILQSRLHAVSYTHLTLPTNREV